MGFDPNQLVYSTTVGSWQAPMEYAVRYRLNANSTWVWDPSPNGYGGCIEQLSHQVRETVNNTIVPYYANYVPSTNSCYLFKQ